MTRRDFFEGFIIVAIVLVIVQTFMHELAIYQHWSINARHILLVSGFFFDLIFTIEFIVRSELGRREGKLLRYWMYERGWVDFLSSVPLFLLDSGPSLFFLLAGGFNEGASTMEVLMVLKVVKAVRVTRILRLVRIIKIFGKIHNTESKMAQHHTSVIATTAVFSIVVALGVFSAIFDRAGRDARDRETLYRNTLITLENAGKRDGEGRELAREILATDPLLLRLDYKGKNLFRKLTDDEFAGYYTTEDYLKVATKQYAAQVSLVDLHRHSALNHIQGFFVIVLVVLSFIVIYTRHFAQNVSDLIHILNKGFRKKDYNLQVKIHEAYADDEIYRLAHFYNDAYLPAKLRRQQDQQKNATGGLSMDDLVGFNKKDAGPR